MKRSSKIPKPSQLTLSQVFEILNAECPNDGMCMLINEYTKKQGWVIRPLPSNVRSNRD